MRSSFSGSSVGAGDLRLIMRVAVHNGVCLTVPEEAANVRMSGSRLRGTQANTSDPRWVEIELHESSNDVFRGQTPTTIEFGDFGRDHNRVSIPTFLLPIADDPLRLTT